jgi:hypothetical protein
MNVLSGRCHCGNLSVRFETAKAPLELPLRSCQCSFCTRHGARTTIDREGRATVSVRDFAKLSRYSWGRHTAEYLVCRDCGGYLGAVATIRGRRYMTMNVNLFDEAARFTTGAEPVDYDAETIEQRNERRASNWTPAEVSWDQALRHEAAEK